MKNPKLLTPHIAKYYFKYLKEMPIDDFKIIIDILPPEESYRLRVYENNLGENITNERLFLFLCNLIDFKQIENEKNTLPD